MSRRTFLTSAACVPLLFVLPRSAFASAIIHQLEGDVFINRRKLSAEMTIKPGDELVVAHDGKLVFSLGGDAFLLRGGTVLSLHHRHNNPLVSVLRLVTGAMLAVFDKRDHPSHVVTSYATIGIRGTGLYVDSQPSRLYTCTCYGHTDLRIKHQKEDVVATHHSAHLVTGAAGGAMQMKVFEVIDHTDDELRMLESLVGRKPAFDS